MYNSSLSHIYVENNNNELRIKRIVIIYVIAEITNDKNGKVFMETEYVSFLFCVYFSVLFFFDFSLVIVIVIVYAPLAGNHKANRSSFWLCHASLSIAF